MSSAVNKISTFNKFGSVLGLERIQELLRRLGNPQKDLKIIHIGGTNGKGSTSRMVYQILREAGYNVGIYTSPFLEVFNERIEYNGEMIPDEYLEKYADIVEKEARAMCDDGLLSPTEFDVVTSIGFMYFAQMGADFVVLEVGLGGTGDSTNVIEKPVVTAITSVSLDHTDRLGETIAEIAADKAGIVKAGIPMICGSYDDEARNIIKKRADEMEAPFVDATKASLEIVEESLMGSRFNCSIMGESFENLELSMIGKHQVENAAVALGIIVQMKKEGIANVPEEYIYSGLKKAANIGRFEVVRENPIVVLDGAHNDAGMKTFVKTAKREFEGKNTVTVVGFLEDKDVDGMIASLKNLKTSFIVTEPDNPRKLTSDKLSKLLEEEGQKVVGIMNPKEVVEYINGCQGQWDAVLVVGSLYLIGEIRRRLNGSE